MKEGVKPLIDRLRNELAGTDVDPEGVMDIFFDWARALYVKGYITERSHDRMEMFERLARDHE